MGWWGCAKRQELLSCACTSLCSVDMLPTWGEKERTPPPGNRFRLRVCVARARQSCVGARPVVTCGEIDREIDSGASSEIDEKSIVKSMVRSIVSSSVRSIMRSIE
eukprot:1610864-Pyramimonas_sp.AAC.1